jgi:alkylated DNA repair dioxygenase AlkB/SAM-dependent methyltransferase
MNEHRIKKYRSILPHEPQPKEECGFIHLQGAFEPKKSDKDDAPYWTSSSLEQALFDALSFRFEALKLPYPVQLVQILDPVAPFTKVRLRYKTAQEAFLVMTAWRSQKLSPSQLFLGDVTFGSHVFQATMITTASLPEPSWTRSNPPKFRRLLHDHSDTSARSQTRFVYMTGLLENQKPESSDTFWKQPHAVLQAIREQCDPYDSSGLGIELFLNKKQHQLAQSAHIGLRSPADAQRIVQEFQGKSVTWQYDGQSISSGTLFLDYVTVTQKSMARSKARSMGAEPEKGEASRPECTSTTDSVQVPGLVVIEDYLAISQEEVLMAVLTGPQAPWAPDQQNMSQTGEVKRLVQHYGYVFDYKTADVLRDRTQSGANCPSMPAVQGGESLEEHATKGRGWEVLAGIIDKTRNHEFAIDTAAINKSRSTSYRNLNQLTLNHYKPGEGIGSHVDTPSAFGDGLISISLNGGIVMEFRKVDSPKTKKLVYLPPRSLVLMSGPARYEWEHTIVTRRTDTHNGTVLPRKLRVSLTLRTALTLEGTPMPLVESSSFPPVWGDKSKVKTGSLVTPTTERDHVHAVYDAIATQWHHTRGKRGVLWPGATQFLKRLPVGSVVADVGCGDGKYFPAVWQAGSYVIGTDISRPLLETAFTVERDNVPDTRKVSAHRASLRDRPAVAVGDCMNVPLRSKSVDAAICIAVMHHLSTPERRARCVEELVRIVRPGGTINIQAWAMEQAQNSRRRFAAPDVFVPFNAQPKYLEKVDVNNSSDANTGGESSGFSKESKSVAELYSENYTKADFDEQKGLVVFQRYCHMYREGELESIVQGVKGAKLIESGYESGNHFVILEVSK